MIPPFLKPRALLSGAIVLLLFLIACKKDNSIPDGEIQVSMLDSVNKIRIAGCTCGTDIMLSVPPLSWNTFLLKSAEAHAKDMYKRNYFDHISLEGTSPIQRATAHGYTGTMAGENIGKGYRTIAEVMAAWKASESHCKAMMDARYIEFGAYSYNGYWVQEFGK